MSRITRVDATLAMAEDLGARLRQSDEQELLAAYGYGGAQALVESVQEASVAHAWLVDGRPICMSGVRTQVEDEGRIGVIWMVASDEAESYRKELFMQGKREYVMNMLNDHDVLINFVDNRNTKSHRWLRWLGFSMGDPVPFGHANTDFRPFWLRPHGESSATRQGTIENIV
jgi:hypothetical protein